jgi:hypothetical protein
VCSSDLRRGGTLRLARRDRRRSPKQRPKGDVL